MQFVIIINYFVIKLNSKLFFYFVSKLVINKFISFFYNLLLYFLVKMEKRLSRKLKVINFIDLILSLQKVICGI